MLKKKGSLHRKSLIIILLITSIPGLITGLSIYGIVTGKVESELQRLHHNKIVQQEKNVDSQFANLELTFAHWAYDLNFGNKLKEIDVVDNYEQVQELYRTLLVIEGSSPIVSTAQLYVNAPRPMVFTKEGYSFLSDPGLIEKYNAMLRQEKSMFWTDGNVNADSARNGRTSLTLVNKLPGVPAEPFGLLIASIDNNKLIELLKSLNPYEEGTTLMLAGDGEWKFTSSGRLTELDQALQTNYLKQADETSSYRYDFQKATYSVSTSKFTRLGGKWVFVSAVPLSSITAPVLLVSKIIVLISVGGLLVALLMTWLASTHLFSAFERLLQRMFGNPELKLNASGFEWMEKKWDSMARESESLRSQLALHTPILREGFLMQLVQGYLFSLSESEVQERLKQLGLDIEGKQFAAIVVQLRGLTDKGARFGTGDEELAAFAAGNIAQELGSRKGIDCEPLNHHDMSLGLFLTFPGSYSSEQCRDMMREFGSELLHMMSSILKLQTVVVLGQTTTQLGHISYVYEEARQSINYMDVTDKDVLIDVEQLNKSLAQREFNYNFSLEKEIIHALRLGSEEEAMKLIRQFMTDLSQAGYKKLILQQGMIQLLGSLQHAMLQSGMNPIVLFQGANLYEELNELPQPDDILNWFRTRVVSVFVQQLINKQDFHLKQVVEKVTVFLRENYMADLSLEACADKFGTSPYTLSRAFKQATGSTFIDYLTGLRIGAAKDLLRDTNLKIIEIAEKVGYQHTYFNRIFKKVESLTPSQYREMQQKDRR